MKESDLEAQAEAISTIVGASPRLWGGWVRYWRDEWDVSGALVLHLPAPTNLCFNKGYKATKQFLGPSWISYIELSYRVLYHGFFLNQIKPYKVIYLSLESAQVIFLTSSMSLAVKIFFSKIVETLVLPPLLCFSLQRELGHQCYQYLVCFLNLSMGGLLKLLMFTSYSCVLEGVHQISWII